MSDEFYNATQLDINERGVQVKSAVHMLTGKTD